MDPARPPREDALTVEAFGGRVLDGDTPSHPRPERRVKLPRAEVCACPGSPWCGGAGSTDWETCSPTCKPCRLPASRPVVAEDPS